MIRQYKDSEWRADREYTADGRSGINAILSELGGTRRAEPLFAILTEDDARNLGSAVTPLSHFVMKYHMSYDGYVELPTDDTGERPKNEADCGRYPTIPYIHLSDPCYETGYDDRALRSDPLEILRELERMRHKSLDFDDRTDYVIRVCEAIVAEGCRFPDRVSWTDAMKRDPETWPAEQRQILSILQRLEMFRLHNEYRDEPPLWVIDRCRTIVARQSLGDRWGSSTPDDPYPGQTALFSYRWEFGKRGAVNCRTMEFCEKNGIKYLQSNGVFLYLGGEWQRLDARCDRGRYLSVYAEPICGPAQGMEKEQRKCSLSPDLTM